MIDGVRFEEPLESEFRRDFDRLGRTSRHEMWAVLLVAVVAGIIFHRTLWGVPPDVPLGPSLLAARANGTPRRCATASQHWARLPVPRRR